MRQARAGDCRVETGKSDLFVDEGPWTGSEKAGEVVQTLGGDIEPGVVAASGAGDGGGLAPVSILPGMA